MHLLIKSFLDSPVLGFGIKSPYLDIEVKVVIHYLWLIIYIKLSLKYILYFSEHLRPAVLNNEVYMVSYYYNWIFTIKCFNYYKVFIVYIF